MTWCPYYKECEAPCHRALTDKVKKESEFHWVYASKPECFKEKKDVK